MSKEAQYEELLALRWLREFNEEEHAQLKRLIADNASMADRWEEDMALIEGLDSLPDVSLSPHFTNRVMARIDRSETTTMPSTMGWLERLGLLPRLGLGLGLALLLLGAFWQYRQSDSTNLAESIAVLTETKGVPSIEELQHFEAIWNLAQVPVEVDWELVAAPE